MKRYFGQGVVQVVRFNWPMYVSALVAIAIGCYLGAMGSGIWSTLAWVGSSLAIALVVLSLLVTFFAYDLTGLYRLAWLADEGIASRAELVNINAGFDEMSAIIADRIPDANLHVFDFYDPRRHTEPSIERARKMFKPYPGTISVDTDSIPLKDDSTDAVFIFFAAHEIRNDSERVAFLREVRRIVGGKGRVYVLEHLRDLPNALAYHFGVFHFHGRATWLADFKSAGLAVREEVKLNPFMTLFKLSANGDTD